MLLYLYMLCFSQATVSVKISNFVSVVFMSYPIDNLKKEKKCYRKCVYCIILLNSGFFGVFLTLFMYYGWDFSGSNIYFIILYGVHFKNYESKI